MWEMVVFEGRLSYILSEKRGHKTRGGYYGVSLGRANYVAMLMQCPGLRDAVCLN